MERQANALGLTFEFMEAVDGARLTSAQVARAYGPETLAAYGRELRPAELGCHLSHEAVWRRIEDGDRPFGVVLEDDVRLGDTFVANLAALAALHRPWELVRLAGTRLRKFHALQPLAQGCTLARLHRGPAGTLGYALTPAGAGKLLRYTERVVHPVDEAIDRYWEHRLDTYAVLPYPVVPDAQHPSTIDGPHGPRRRVAPQEGRWVPTVRRRLRWWRSSLQRRRYNWFALGLFP
jgi:glycosyl transferase, family 25